MELFLAEIKKRQDIRFCSLIYYYSLCFRFDFDSKRRSSDSVVNASGVVVQSTHIPTRFRAYFGPIRRTSAALIRSCAIAFRSSNIYVRAKLFMGISHVGFRSHDSAAGVWCGRSEPHEK